MAGYQGDYRYLIEDFNEEEDTFLDYKDSDLLKALFNDLENEYKTLVADKKLLRREKALLTILELNARYSLATHVLTMYSENPYIEVLDILNSVEGLSFSEDKDISSQIEIAYKKILGWKNKLKIMEVNFKIKYKIDKEKEEPEFQLILSNLDKKSLFFELNLETGYRIDPKNTNVVRWVNLEERSNAKLDRNG